MKNKYIRVANDSSMDQNKYFNMSPCPVCGVAASKPSYPIYKRYASEVSGVDLASVPIKVDICQNCGHQFIQPVPTPSFLRLFYSAYMEKAKDGFYRERYQSDIPTTFRHRYGRWLDRMVQLSVKGGKLLDVGAGAGMFLRLAQQDYKFSVSGIEPSVEEARMLRELFGISVHNCFLEEVKAEQEYDIVTMWDLLEHLPNPGAALKKARELLKTKGLLVIEIPLRDSFVHCLVKTLYWLSCKRIQRPLTLVYGIHHLHYFSQRSISDFVEENGFKIIEIYRVGTDLSALRRRSSNNILSYTAIFLYNTCLSVAFGIARILRMQNKCIIFAQKKHS
jgi:2-polyprenyl-3-methyl-5-hydroxy-6-metoxy-1,4-benzoquinol methylase